MIGIQNQSSRLERTASGWQLRLGLPDHALLSRAAENRPPWDVVSHLVRSSAGWSPVEVEPAALIEAVEALHALGEPAAEHLADWMIRRLSL